MGETDVVNDVTKTNATNVLDAHDVTTDVRAAAGETDVVDVTDETDVSGVVADGICVTDVTDATGFDRREKSKQLMKRV